MASAGSVPISSRSGRSENLRPLRAPRLPPYVLHFLSVHLDGQQNRFVALEQLKSLAPPAVHGSPRQSPAGLNLRHRLRRPIRVVQAVWLVHPSAPDQVFPSSVYTSVFLVARI